MYKKFMLIVFATILGGRYAGAQSCFINLAQGNNHYPQQKNSNSSSRTTGNSSRLICGVVYNYDGASFVYYDSTILKYSGGRGGDLNHPLKFDEQNDYGNPSLTSSATVNTFDVNNNITNTFIQVWMPNSGTWQDTGKWTYTYDAMNNVLSALGQRWDTASGKWMNNGNSLYTYDANNNNTRAITMAWNSTASAWDTSGDKLITYTNSNKVATQTSRRWNPDSSSWLPVDNTIFSYDQNDNLAFQHFQMWNAASNAWEDQDKSTYLYDANNNLASILFQYWFPVTNAWLNTSKYIFSDFAAQQPQTEIDQYWNDSLSAFVSYLKTNSTYNSFGQLTYRYTQHLVPAGWATTTSDNAYRYSYENYNTSVHNITSVSGQANVYPVPTKTTLTIELTWNAPQAYSISIINLQGKIIRQWEMPSALQYNGSISIGDLPPGNYFLKIDGSDGSITKQLTITN